MPANRCALISWMQNPQRVCAAMAKSPCGRLANRVWLLRRPFLPFDCGLLRNSTGLRRPVKISYPGSARSNENRSYAAAIPPPCSTSNNSLLTPLSHVPQPPASKPTDLRYILLNLQRIEIQADSLQKIKSLAGSRPEGRPRLGVAAIISYFRHSPEKSRATTAVAHALRGARTGRHRAARWRAVVAGPARPVELVGQKPTGYDPANAANVEWSGWGPEHALKIAWRNWGQQRRVLPPPNLMSPRYRDACHAEMKPLLAEIVRWRNNLPEDKRWLFVGVKVGWESAIGMGSHYYPNGNSSSTRIRPTIRNRERKPQDFAGPRLSADRLRGRLNGRPRH